MSEQSFEHAPVAASATAVISFCNQVASPFHSLLALNRVSSGVSWIDFLDIGEQFAADLGGICGICCVGNQIVAATQGSCPVLASINLQNTIVDAVMPLRRCRDTHSIVYHDNYLYFVSTGTNEVYRVSFRDGVFGEEELHWQYPGVRYDSDEIHLNGVAVENDRLVASCFGERDESGSWGSGGKVFYLDSGKVIHEGLKQPHTPLVVGEWFFFAESGAHKVYAYRKFGLGDWVQSRVMEFKGYTRGLAFEGDQLLVGISADRKVSRSRKTVNVGWSSADGEIVVVDIATGQQMSLIDTTGFGREIYDIVLFRGHLVFDQALAAVLSRVRELESIFDRNIAQYARLWGEVGNLRGEVGNLRDSLSKHAEELERIHNSFCWRIAIVLRSIWSRVEQRRWF